MGDERQIPREMHLRGVFSDEHGFDFLIAAGTRSVSNNSQILLDNPAGKFLICFKSSLPLFCFLTLYIRDFTPVIVQILSLHTLPYPRNLGPLFKLNSGSLYASHSSDGCFPTAYRYI